MPEYGGASLARWDALEVRDALTSSQAETQPRFRMHMREAQRRLSLTTTTHSESLVRLFTIAGDTQAPVLPTMSDNDVSASAKGATFMVLLTIGSRAITFALNQVLLRFLSPQLLGVAVQLELYIISTLYFSRESLRIATQRRSDGGVQAAINLSYLAIIAGLPIGAFLAQMYLRTNYPDVPYLTTALRINEFTAMGELLSEPAFVAVQQNMLYKTRAAAEATAVVMKTLATAGTVFWSRYNGLDLGVLPFAVGELAYSASLTVVYISQTSAVARLRNFTLLPQKMKSRCVLRRLST
jgi:oligosaccharide translocation protein RFT1